MTVVWVSKHVIKPLDTADTLVREYRLSSWSAIVDIDANRNCRAELSDPDNLPSGTTIDIPPNAGHLVKDRLYCLHRLGPLLRHHFAAMQREAELVLRQALCHSGGAAGNGNKNCITDPVKALLLLSDQVAKGIDALAEHASPLVTVCVGMAQTHVVQDYDRKAAGTAGDPLCGLYWALTPAKLKLWRRIWDRGTHEAKWSGLDPDAAWIVSQQYLTTIRSLVLQQLDTRIREAQNLERRLFAEQGRS